MTNLELILHYKLKFITCDKFDKLLKKYNIKNYKNRCEARFKLVATLIRNKNR